MMSGIAICEKVNASTAATEIQSRARYGRTNAKKRLMTSPLNAAPNICSSWLTCEPTAASGGLRPLGRALVT